MAALTMFVKPISDIQQKKYKYLMCVSSFKRPIFLSGQLWRLMNQSYQNFDISVSVKGVDKHWADKTFMKEWMPLMKQKLILLRFDKNRGQMSNFLDTVRDVDLNKYDYFCKIDDDDWYAPGYLENINTYLNREEGITITLSLNSYILNESIEKNIFFVNNTELSGPTMCFSRKVIQLALEVEKNPSLLGSYVPDRSNPIYLLDREDSILHRLSVFLGKEQFRNEGYPLVMYGQQYKSVIRNDNYVRY